MEKHPIRHTHENRIAQTIRVVLGLLFIMTGIMKLAVPLLSEAFAAQLEAGEIPFRTLNLWLVPIAELALGFALLIGLYARLAVLGVYATMIVAMRVHVLVDDPSLFPLQPVEPIVPIIVMVLATYVLAKGAGSGSYDLAASELGDGQS